jgi:hypothetical protein
MRCLLVKCAGPCRMRYHQCRRSAPGTRLPADEITGLKLSPAIRVLIEMPCEMGKGRTVALRPMQAADCLNLSRPFVVGFIKAGVLPVRVVDNQRRVPLPDAATCKADGNAKCKAAPEKLADVNEEFVLR